MPESGLPAKRRRGIFGASVESALGTGTSRLLGAVRDIALSHVFGDGRALDVFWMAWTVPSLFRRFVADEGLTGALIGGTLNRVMIAELGLPASLVGLFFAIPLLISPVRVWLGYRSDGFPIFGRRREPYMILGGLVTGIGIILATTIAVNIAQTTMALFIGMLVAFIVYGVGRNLGHNTFQALVSDRFASFLAADFDFPITGLTFGRPADNVLRTGIGWIGQLIDLLAKHGESAQVFDPVFTAWWIGRILL